MISPLIDSSLAFYRNLNIIFRVNYFLLKIEALRSKLRRIFDPQGKILFPIRSLTPQQATGNALAAGFSVGR
jgi:hypothetical protein